jgi:hypothetical protein
VIPGVRGRLVTASFARELLPGMPGSDSMLSEPMPATIGRAVETWFERVDATLGPASSVRSITDTAALPLLRILGYSLVERIDSGPSCLLRLAAGGGAPLVLHVVGWGLPLDPVWRPAVLGSISTDARWVLCCNGAALRIVDGQRTWSRDYLEFDLAHLGDVGDARMLLWSLVRAAAMAAAPPLLDSAVAMSARHGVEVCRSLGGGVLESLRLLMAALPNRREPAPVLFEQSLTVIYRVLFLLFAEARGLVPIWHPVYRDRYCIDTIVAALVGGGRYRGLWHALQAISRLAHAGYSSPDLSVMAFNGRLFAPGQSRAFDRTPIDDGVMGSVVLALGSTTVNRRGGRARIAYRDLDVEQLGAVYEQVLDYEPDRLRLDTLARSGDARKSSGTFYTPRLVTAALVRQTLEPLVNGRTCEEILALRVLDPAMGSGAFLVGACRYLAARAEAALVRDGRWHPHDVTAADRAALRRAIASRCLFGADLNPMAVQLARLSLWLVTLAADKPLSFLDHHFVSGDSLVGAAPADLQRQPSRMPGRGTSRRRRQKPLALFEVDGLPAVLEDAVRTRAGLSDRPDDSTGDVRAKEQTLAQLDAPGGPLGRWRRALDLWCAGWFRDDGSAIDRGTFHALADHALHGRSTLPEQVAGPLLAAADAVAARCRFLHWELAFPEVFVDERGQRRPDAGFDAVIGNPPWDMVRGDSGDAASRAGRQRDAQRLTGFVRESGIYRVETRAHVNRYQLFVQRALQLVRRGGRIGLVLPSGIASDVGAAPLRRLLFDQAAVDDLTGLDNRRGIFPIHRSVRFVLLSATAGEPTTSTRCRFGLTSAEDLDRDGEALVLPRELIARLSGSDDLGFPEIASAQDLAIVERIAATSPRLGASAGWGAAFGRELNATDDRDAFVPASGRPDARPVVEGKQIEPFRVAIDRCRLDALPSAAATRRVPRRERLVYRDIASAGNRLTLIAAIVPARAVTTHTLFCLKTPLPRQARQVLCGLLNSFVANYLIRMRVSTHVTATLMSRLPVPYLDADHPLFDKLARLTTALERGTRPAEEMPQYAELQALAAHLYGLSPGEFEHVLGTFPLIPSSVRDAALREFTRLRSS